MARQKTGRFENKLTDTSGDDSVTAVDVKRYEIVLIGRATLLPCCYTELDSCGRIKNSIT